MREVLYCNECGQRREPEAPAASRRAGRMNRGSSAATAGGAAPRGPSIDGRPLEDRTAAQDRYVWACSVCRDPNYTREGPATLYLAERYCPTCDKRQPIIVFDTTLSEVAR